MRLTELCHSGGCGAKMPWPQLQNILAAVEDEPLPAWVTDGYGDSAVVEPPDYDHVSVHSVDFGTPVSDDAYEWGRIAAENAMSDIWACGARPRVAQSILGWPERHDIDVGGDPRAVLGGAIEQLRRAGAALAGGHSMSSSEPFFGLAVTGHVKRGREMGNDRGRPGDVLVMTKPVGSGLAISAMKQSALSEGLWRESVAWMVQSNGPAAIAAANLGAVCATDVSGNGVIGHAHVLGKRSGLGVRLDPLAVRAMGCVESAFSQGVVPRAAESMMLAAEAFSDIASLPVARRLLLCDPQTSGGLLIALPSEVAPRILERVSGAYVVGSLDSGRPGRVEFAEVRWGS